MLAVRTLKVSRTCVTIITHSSKKMDKMREGSQEDGRKHEGMDYDYDYDNNNDYDNRNGY